MIVSVRRTRRIRRSTFRLRPQRDQLPSPEADFLRILTRLSRLS